MKTKLEKGEYEKSNIFVTDVAQHYQRKWLFVITLFLLVATVWLLSSEEEEKEEEEEGRTLPGR